MNQNRRDPEFYAAARRIVGEITKIHNTEYIRNNLQIPNLFRIDDRKMKICITKVEEDRPIKIKQLLNQEMEGEVQLHILRRPMLAITSKNETTVLPVNSSWNMDAKALRSELHVEGDYSRIIVEVRQPLEPDERPEEDDSQISQSVVFTPTEEDFKRKRSFLRVVLPQHEIHSRIRFIDSECTFAKGKQRKAPLSVAILDYSGKVILNKKITPRNRIQNFGQSIHGITERNSRNQEDEYEVIKDIQRLVKNKILIGHDLALELSSLMIPKYQLMGIRDFANAKAFKTRNIIKKNRGEWFSLKALAKEICGLTIQTAKHSALEDVKAVREIYLKVEQDWEDDIKITMLPQKIILNKLSLQEYRDDKKQKSQVDPTNKKRKSTQLSGNSNLERELWDRSPDCQIIEEDIIMEEVIIATTNQVENINTKKLKIDQNKNVCLDTNDLVKYNNMSTNTDEIILKSRSTDMDSQKLTETNSDMTIPTDEYLEIMDIFEDNLDFNVSRDVKEVATETRGWDMEVDNLLNEKIIVQGEEYIRKTATIEYKNAEGKSKVMTLNF